MCLRGAAAVEDLRVGDRVISRDRGAVTLERIDRRRQRFVPVRFSDALTASGSGPALLPAGQSLFIRGWRARLLAGADRAVLPVGDLVDEEFITAGKILIGDLFQLRFDAPHVIYAGGLDVAMAGHLI